MKLRILLIAFLMMLIPLQNEAKWMGKMKFPKATRPKLPKPKPPKLNSGLWGAGYRGFKKQEDERRKRSKVQTPFGKGRSKGVSPTPSASANIKALTRSSKMKKEFLHKQQVYHKNARLNQKFFKADSVIERLHSDSLKLQ